MSKSTKNAIRGWDYEYLKYASNKSQLEDFLQEQNDITLLEKARLILREEDTISFGFVAGRILELDQSGRANHNPLYSIWGELRERARSILMNPSFSDPLGYSYLDYRLAAWVLSVIDNPMDLQLCLEVYSRAEDNISLKSDLATTIISIGQQSFNLHDSVQENYRRFLLEEELRPYPKDNLRAIRGLLLDSHQDTWLDYLRAVQLNPSLNDKLDSNVLFYLFQSSRPEVIQFTISVLDEFTKDNLLEHPLHHFYQQATENDKDSFLEYSKCYESLEEFIKNSNNKKLTDKSQIEMLQRVIISNHLYKGLNINQITRLINLSWNYVLSNKLEFGFFVSFIILVDSNINILQEKYESINDFVQRTIDAIDKHHQEQLFPLDSLFFIKNFPKIFEIL